jgi:tryptophanyl-tRNA synthetase
MTIKNLDKQPFLNNKKRVLSGIQPTGSMHIGNYFGAIKNWVKIQNEYDCIYSIADLHAMTMSYNPTELKKNTFQMIIDLLACGIDPEKSILFIQSLVPEHTELAWILSCVTSYGELTRMTQFKDKSTQIKSNSKNNFISVALFTYPILQVADILIYKANFVPVGKDQIQHLELSRNVAIRFNKQFGNYFPEPQPLLTDIPSLLSLADPTKKMSKSLGDKHYIGLFEDEESIRKKVKIAVTDTGQQQGKEMSLGTKNLFNLIKSCGKETEYNELLKQYRSGNLKYKELKDVTTDALIELTSSFRQKRNNLMNEKDRLERLIKKLSEKARNYANQTIKEVKKLIELPIICQ